MLHHYTPNGVATTEAVPPKPDPNLEACEGCGKMVSNGGGYAWESCGCPESKAIEKAWWAELTRPAREIIERQDEAREATRDRLSAFWAGWESHAADNPSTDALDLASAPSLTLADFQREVTLMDVERLPSAFTRCDGETLLYQGRFNTLYGEAAVGKTWVALMAVIQQIKAGGNVLWWDAEDRPETLAKRLAILKGTHYIGIPQLAWVSGELQDSPLALQQAYAHLDGGAIPGLVVIDSATSFGCPSDGADVSAWLNAFINPWWSRGNTTLLLDHVPKRKIDRPRGGIGSQAKLARIDGAALFAHGTPWNGQEGGFINLTVHKDRQGGLPAVLNGTAATVTAEWNGAVLDWSVGLPYAKPEGEDLQIELMDALEGAGAEGVKGSRALRELLKGKRAKDIDAAREELLQAGMIERVKDGRGYIYTLAR